MTNTQVYEAWAKQSKESARNPRRSCSFEGAVAYSYRAPIAQLLTRNGTTVAILSRKWYSVTTGKHQSLVWSSAYRAGLTIFHGEPFEGADSLVEGYVSEIRATLDRATRARKYREQYLESAMRTISEANSLIDFLGMDRPPLRLP